MTFDDRVTYEHEQKTYDGHLVHPGGENRPIVLVAHAWGGLSDFEIEAARRLRWQSRQPKIWTVWTRRASRRSGFVLAA